MTSFWPYFETPVLNPLFSILSNQYHFFVDRPWWDYLLQPTLFMTHFRGSWGLIRSLSIFFLRSQKLDLKLNWSLSIFSLGPKNWILNLIGERIWILKSRINLSDSSSFPADGLRNMVQLKPLKSLSLDGSGIRLSPKSFKVLAKLKNLERLSLAYSPITDAG